MPDTRFQEFVTFDFIGRDDVSLTHSRYALPCLIVRHKILTSSNFASSSFDTILILT
jgi:hypothetical protein